MAKVHGESKLTFLESTSIIIGHGVGSGILSVPFLASRNNWHDIIWIAAVAYCMNLLLHFMIAELSLNNNGAQFIKCFENELFVGKLKMACTWLAFGLLGFSVVVNVSGFITGAAAVFSAWFHLPSVAGMLLFYVLAASVVYIGMKLVGICEKIAVISMFGVIGILFVATMLSETTELSTKFYSNNNMLALYSMIAFSLSAVMSVPQVVKGLEGDEKGIRKAIATGTGLNMGLILLITFMTLLGCSNVTENGALVDLSGHLGGWVSIIGYVFSLLALATSFWANTLNLRDIVNEQIYLPSEMNEWGLHRSVLRTDFSKVNLNFSPDYQNYAPAEVDFRILEDGDILEVRIVQYIPLDFLQETYDYVSDPFYTGDRNFDKNIPMKGNYTLSYRFSRIED